MLDALRRLDLDEHMLVVFNTDHGIAITRAKSTLYDAGIGIALIVRYPARGWFGGRVQRELVSNVDLGPTLCWKSPACQCGPPSRDRASPA